MAASLASGLPKPFLCLVAKVLMEHWIFNKMLAIIM